MTKIKRFLMYLLTYIAITFLTALGVVLISNPTGASNQSTNVDNGNQSQVTSPITYIIDNFSTLDGMNINANAQVKTQSQNILIGANVLLNMENGLQNIAAQGALNVKINETEIPVNITFLNGELYLSLLNGNYKIETENLMQSVTQILNLLNVEMPNLGFDLENLDLNSLLSMFDGIKEEKTNTETTLTIELPFVGNITIVCDLNYSIKSIDVPAVNIDGTELSVQVAATYPEDLEVSEPEQEFINVTHVLNLVEGLINFTKNNQIGLTAKINYNNFNFEGILSCDLTNYSAKFETTILNEKLQVFAIDNVIYVEFGNLFAKFDLNSVSEIAELLKNHFGINIPIEQISELLVAISKNTASLENLNFDLNDFDISKIDLSILEKFNYENGVYSLSITNIGEIKFEFVDHEFKNITFEGLNIFAKLESTTPQKINLTKSEETYANLNDVLPLANSILNTIKLKHHFGTINLSVNNINLNINYELDLLNELKLKLETQIYNIPVSVVIIGENVYVQVSEVYLTCSLSDISKLAQTIKENLNLDLPQISVDDVKNIVSNILTQQSLLISKITKTDAGLEIEILEKLKLNFGYNNYVNWVNVSGNNFNVNATLTSNNEQGNFDFDKTKYVSVSNVIENSEQIINFIKAKKFYADVNITYGDFEIYGFVNFEPNGSNILDGLSASLNTTVLGKQVSVKLLNGVIYAELDGFNAMFNINDVDKVLDFVKKHFNLDVSNALKTITKNFDLQGDNSILKGLTLTLLNNTLTIKNDLAQILINFENKDLLVSYNDLSVYAQLTNKKQDVTILNNYFNISKLLPFAESLLNTINANKFAGNMNVVVNNKPILVEYKVSLNPLQIWASTNIFGLNIKLNVFDNAIYATVGNVNVCASFSELENIISLICEKLNINLTPDANSILNSISFGDIKILSATNTNLKLNLFNTDVELLFNDTIKTININNTDVKAKLDLTKFADNVLMPVIDTSAYENIEYIVNLVKTNLKNLQNKQLELNGEINISENFNLPVYAQVNFENDLQIKLATNVLNKTIEIIFSNNTIYANIDGLKAQYDLNNLESLIKQINSNFNTQINTKIDTSNIKIYISKFKKFETNLGYGFNVNFVINGKTIAATVEFNKLNELKNITAQFEGISIILNTTLGAETNIEFNESDYTTNLDDLTTLIKPIANLINAKAFELNGTIKFDLFDAKQELTINSLKVDFNDVNNLKLSASIEFYGININLTILNGTIYAQISDLKLYIKTTEISELVNWINTTFNLSEPIDLGGMDLNNIINLIGEFALGENIKQIYKTENGLMIDLYDYVSDNLSTTPQELVLSYNENFAQIILNHTKLFANINFVKFGNVEFESLAEADYVHYSTLTNIIENTTEFIKTKQFSLIANAEVYDGEKVTTNALVNLDLDIKNNLLLNGKATLTGKYNIGFDINYWNKYLFVNYNNLKLKICEEDLKNLLAIILNLLGVDPNLIPILEDAANDLNNINFDSVSNLIPSFDVNNPLTLLKIVKNIEFANNNLKITLDGTQLSDNPNAQNMVVQINTTNNCLSGVQLTNIYTGVTNNEHFNLNINFETFKGVQGVSDDGYIDLSGANELIKAIINTAELNYYEIDGSLKINGDLIGIGINWDVPLNVKIKLDENRKPEIMATIGAIPVVPAVNDDAPYKFGNTVSGIYAGLNRILTVYYKDEFVYFYRHEEVPVFASSNRIYEKKLKVSLEELIADPLKYVQYAIGFTDDIMKAITESLALSEGHTPNLGNVINSFVVNDSKNFKIELNMQELTNDPKMGTMTIGLGVVNNEQTNNKNYVGNATFNMYMPLADVFKLTLESNNLKLINIGKTLDFNSMYSYISSYTYSEGASWEAYDGEWTKADEVIYTIAFEENGGSELNNISGAPGSAIVLPTYTENLTINNVQNNTKYVYEFAGWYTSPGLEENTKFVSSVMPRKDTTLYAKWNLTETIVTKYYTIKFNLNGGNGSYSDLTIAENTSVDLSAYVPHKCDDKVSGSYVAFKGRECTHKKYTFAGWYLDPELTKPYNGEPITGDITLYAKYTTSTYFHYWGVFGTSCKENCH